MAVLASDYEALLRSYDEKRQRNALKEASIKASIYEKHPDLAELQLRIAENGAERARAKITGNTGKLQALSEEASALREEKDGKYRAYGLSDASFEPPYDCPLCKDTGFIGKEKCRCFIMAAVDLLYKSSHLNGVAKDETFDTMSMAYYDDTPDEKGESEKTRMMRHVAALKAFCGNIDREAGNFLLRGAAGTGKTFLANCVANELLSSCHSVLYFTAAELVRFFERNRPSGYYDEDSRDELYDFLLNADLLVIDDLGTETVNTFTQSKLFFVLNGRLSANRSTIISTNMTMNTLSEFYTERVASRIAGNYKIITLKGSDIRLMKSRNKQQ